jgi:crotonobetainyl-CoA:carnitine CoA-transferase CaiB-like acyl-CoA transferase
MDRPELVPERANREVVDAAISAWTRTRAPHEIESTLQAADIASHAALDMPGLFADEQLAHRGHFIEIAHDLYPTTTIESSRLRLARAAPRQPGRALSLGRDNRHVLEHLLGYSPARIADLAERGVLS